MNTVVCMQVAKVANPCQSGRVRWGSLEGEGGDAQPTPLQVSPRGGPKSSSEGVSSDVPQRFRDGHMHAIDLQSAARTAASSSLFVSGTILGPQSHENVFFLLPGQFFG
jgi:hypothetical protein